MGNPRTIRASVSDDAVELFILSEISSWTAQDFMSAVKFYGNSKPYTLNIYSPGGDPFAAFAIHDYIKASGAKVTARIWGHAASAAAIIACSCERVEMGEMSYLMIHNAYGGDGSNSSENLLADLNEKQVSIFKKRSGKTAAAITKLMEAETWMDAKAAKDFGFADAIIKELAIAALFKAEYMDPNEKKEGEEVKTETPEAVPEVAEATEEVEQEIPVTTEEAIKAAFSGKIKAKVKVSAEMSKALADAVAEVKDVKAKADEAIAEVEGLKEKLAKAEAEVKAKGDELATAKASTDTLNAKVSEITAAMDKLKKAPLASAEGDGTATPAVVPGGGREKPKSYAEQKRSEKEEEMRRAYEASKA